MPRCVSGWPNFVPCAATMMSPVSTNSKPAATQAPWTATINGLDNMRPAI